MPASKETPCPTPLDWKWIVSLLAPAGIAEGVLIVSLVVGFDSPPLTQVLVAAVVLAIAIPLLAGTLRYLSSAAEAAGSVQEIKDRLDTLYEWSSKMDAQLDEVKQTLEETLGELSKKS